MWHQQGVYLPSAGLVEKSETILGRGSFADVYRGQYQLPGKPVAKVALKIFRGGCLDPSILQQVNDEIKVAQRLQHHNLVKVYGLCELPTGALSLVMELADGGSLQNVLSDRDQFPELPWPVRVRWLRDVATGMKELQSMFPPIVHRFLCA